MSPSLGPPALSSTAAVARSSPNPPADDAKPFARPLRLSSSASSPRSPAFPSSPIRRKPLPVRQNPDLASISSTSSSKSTVGLNTPSPPFSPLEPFEVRDLDKFPHGHTPLHTPHDSIAVFPPARAPDARSSNAYSSDRSLHVHSSNRTSLPLAKQTPFPLPPPNTQQPALMALHPPSTRPPPLRIDLNSRKISSGSIDYKQLPKTPGGRITSFFGWKSAASPGNESVSTEISDSILSPMPSPMNASTQPSAQSSRFPSRDSFAGASPKLPPSRSQSMPTDNNNMASKLAEMENELREISCELAGSIRREMDLEDLVDRLQSETTTLPGISNRNSDHFSDSGYGSVKYPMSDAGFSRADDVDKMKREFEQERAQLKVDLSQRLQEERSKRQAADSHVQILETQVNQLRREKVEASNASARAKELEAALDDTRRRLTEERQIKDNFEDLLTAMRVELEQHRNERDQLQNRMQQEIQVLRNENSLLSQSRKMISEQQPTRFNSIAEEDGDFPQKTPGLTRSNSLARIPPTRSGGLSRSESLSRPSSIIGKERDFRESLADRVKDVETQRDALHQTVKSLLERQSYEAKKHEKRIRILEIELGRAKQSTSPRKQGYEREVTTLREEINILRRRADDALDQKWQCEKGLAGLKMDLDRAEQETASLRVLLLEHAVTPIEDENDTADFHATASSLEHAYIQLQSNRQRNSRLASDDAFISDVMKQVATNSALRGRLSEAIGRGEREQKLSAERINDMQTRLKLLEDTLILAQQQSEDEIAKHEQEIATLKESHSAQLLRAKNGARTPALLSPIMPPSPFSGPRSPRLQVTTSGPGVALNQAVQVSGLEAKVKELEKALRDADTEMKHVVGRMNMAQIEVAELQADRDEALRQTRKLQAQILEQINDADV
ncbi:hypothetical protein LOZ52_001222 [Ophidiomyces ophidiicola]|nr:hypothetical protein LOZ64_001155 [Ophidiomyces ophidiicola]KAI2008128.1 hypothetical protein LOZ50_002126 [Ophidiomyces ophidiicola]KAI2025792.1 hypothetical protein LOZ46_000726 [Ophidiomyces ophidiicola]KAI2142449.1 hypothetical protein LOZ29_001515 [Ophidiomyces ophidiicola]KAI2145462.1 hypothetical protein LOZ28_001062 [Ophidiomyces ophidiicola]